MVNFKFKLFLFVLLIVTLTGCTNMPPQDFGKTPVFNDTPFVCNETYFQGKMYYNNVTDSLYICNGTSWRTI